MFASKLYVYITEFVGSVLAFSIDIIFIFDCITAPCVLISAIPKYLLSLEIAVSIATVVERYDLNNSFPFGLYIAITVLWLPPLIITDTYPFLFTLIFPNFSFYF